MKQIHLDCSPGNPRPGDLIERVIEGTGLELKEPVSTVFGHWTWDYEEVTDEQWDNIKPILKDRINKLYEDNIIRFGSWN